MSLYKYTIKLVFMLLMPIGLCFGQELDKVVFVESAFKPIIENAEKMGVLPVL